MKNKEIDLYTYAASWGNSAHASNLWKTIRRTYFIKSILLFLALPFDAFIIFFRVISRRYFKLFIVTEKWPDLTDMAAEHTEVGSIASPNFYINHFKSKAKYLPASVFYLLAALGLAMPVWLRLRWSSIVVRIISYILIRLIGRSATLVVHSDALPFGRALVVAANKAGLKTVCIQHGNFREYNVIGEMDGFLCTDNIVRSVEDGEIVKKANVMTKIHVIPEFFRLKVVNISAEKSSCRVLLLGEGYHIIDEKFNTIYLNHLELLQNELSRYGIEVAFRPHPSERKMAWGNKFKKIDTGLLESSLSITDAVIGYSSTLLQEAAEIGVPSFFLDPLSQGHKIEGRNGANINKYVSPEQIIKVFFDKKNNNNEMDLPIQEDEYSKVLSVLLEGSCQ